MISLLRAFLALALLITPAVAAPVIHEFVAENETGLADVDGDFSDWIEIHNPDPIPVNLENWCLTDNASNLTKWRFPAVTIPPGGFLVVFASGKDRRNPGQELHTNFSLDRAGEYLALVHPDGQTSATKFEPAFPPQRDGFSYGFSRQTATVNLLDGVTAKILVPTQAAQLPADWNWLQPMNVTGFDPVAGPGAIGYETTAPPTGNGNVAPTGTATQSTTGFGAGPGNAIDLDYGNFTHTTSTDNSPTWQLAFPSDRDFRSIKLFNRTSCCGSRLRDITVQILTIGGQVVYTSSLLNPENTGYSFPNGPPTLEVDLVAETGGAVTGRIIRIRRTPDPDLSGSGGQGNEDEASVLSLGEVEVQVVSSLHGFFSNNIQSAMLNVNSSVFTRWNFNVTDPGIVQSLKLRVRYDDGFIAYLNGTKIAERNAPASPAWNSAALSERPDGQAIGFEEIDVTAFASALVEGENVLAIHGLTSAPNDPDFLLDPQLIANTRTENDFASYLETPTPGAENDSAWFVDFVGDTNFSVKRGFYSAPFQVAITTQTPDAQIYYSTNGEEPGPGTGTLYTGPITISQTTILRARAFKPNWRPTNVDTNTYIFLNDVLGQAANGQPPPGWPASPIINASNEQQRMDYGMDPVLRSAYGNPQLFEALQQIPSISIVTRMANLFDPQTGIYANAKGHGDEWERPASIEWLDPSAPAGAQGLFQENCGLRIRGGFSREPQFVKHSFRVYFRRDYGVPKLRFPIFGDRGTDEHDVIDLATSQNYSWARSGPSEGDYDTLLRDPFCRETLLATGSPACRNRYFHLYLNGLYWGIYYFDERVSPGYGEAYFGGSKDDYDVIKTGNHSQGFVTEATAGYLDTMPGPNGTTVTAPWRQLWNKARAFATAGGVTQNGNPNLAAYFEMLGCNADGTRNPALPVLVDADSLIDYLLVIFYSGDGDAPLSSFLSNDRANNWFSLRNRNNPNRGFVFFNHDAEHTLGAPSSQIDRTGPWVGGNQNNFMYSNPQWLFQDLAYSPEFRIRVADRAHRHFFNDGVMTPAKAQARVDALAAQINLAIKAYAMRWGNTNKTPAYNHTNWQSAVNTARSWLTNRTSVVVQQLRNYRLTTSYPEGSAPLYPNVVAPSFSQHGGNVPAGYSLTMTSPDVPAGTIYYTLDGTDPRAVGGAISPTAQAYTAAVTLPGPSVTVRARTLKSGVWSAMNEAVFFSNTVEASAENIVISEIHYHPADPTPAEISAGFTDANDFEFIELMNISGQHVNLTGVQFTAGITFVAPALAVAPGERIVFVRNPAAFSMRYGTGITIAGTFEGQLNNAGERITLKTAGGTIIRDFEYSDSSPWPESADGLGASLTLIAPFSNPNHAAPENWRASSALVPSGGTPAASDGTTYADWKLAHNIGSDDDDPENDGLSAVLEYAVGGNPDLDSSHLLPKVATLPDGQIRLTMHRAVLADDVQHEIQMTTDLQNWAPANATLVSRSLSGNVETLVFDVAVPAPGENCFLRVRYQLQ